MDKRWKSAEKIEIYNLNIMEKEKYEIQSKKSGQKGLDFGGGNAKF